MLTRDSFLVADRLARLQAEADRARLARLARRAPMPDTPGVGGWRVTVGLALFALADVIARPAPRDDACADCT
jgi:hypothetical protein